MTVFVAPCAPPGSRHCCGAGPNTRSGTIRKLLLPVALYMPFLLPDLAFWARGDGIVHSVSVPNKLWIRPIGWNCGLRRRVKRGVDAPGQRVTFLVTADWV